MAIHARSNLYPGVNAHLNSFLQQPGGGWESFHAEHIVDIRRVIAAALPPNYYATAEKSLQLSTYDAASLTAHVTRPDIGLMQRAPSVIPSAVGGQSLKPSASYALAPWLALDEEEALMSVLIYAYAGSLPGRLVTRIELLSPGNKPPAADHRPYLARCKRTLRSGVALVEIDYLHQTPPANPALPSYADGDPNAYPYSAAVSIPQPTPLEGHTDYYGWAVTDKLPTLPIPLAGDEHAPLDLALAYQRTYESAGFFDQVVDYAQDPPAFDRYRPADREQIAALLAEIRRAPPADAP
jgi:hypothetical protein